MDKDYYKVCIKRWEKYRKDLKTYTDKRKELVEKNASDKEFSELDSKFNIFGPFTIIRDPNDLLDPNFFLPGYDSTFLNLKNTDHKIPEYFGKTLHSEYDDDSGVVVEYAYDAYDDYIGILSDSGKIKYILVNSRYRVDE